MRLLLQYSVALSILGLALGLVEDGHCRDLSCAPREHLLSALSVMRQQISELEYQNNDSNCTACFSSPCLNGGICKADGKIGYRCDCPYNADGHNCEKIIVCNANSCGANADCFVQNHQTNCVCKFGYSGNPIKGCGFQSKKVCATGDPHYNTFDGASYDYQSTCPYIFSAPCNGSLSGGYNYFRVKAKNQVPYPRSRVSNVESVEVEMYNQTVFVDAQLNVFFNGIQAAQIVTGDLFMECNGHLRIFHSSKRSPVHVPFYYPSAGSPKITIKLIGSNIVIKNDQFVEIDFRSSVLCLIVPDVPAFQGPNTLCGLTGNLDGNCKDDFLLPDLTTIPIKSCSWLDQSQVDDFGDSWATTEYTSWGPTDACLSGHIMTNSSTKCDLTSAQVYCQSIFDAKVGKGPLAACAPMGNVTIQRMYDNCLYDTCRDPNTKCNSITTFVHQCQAQLPGTDLGKWRWDPSIQCEPQCPANSEYGYCVSSCPATCAEHSAPDTCDQPCFEGCACKYGYVLDTSEPSRVSCIPVEDCGCKDDMGNFNPPNDHWLTNNCMQDNTCSNGTFVTAPYSCSNFGHCDIVDRKYECECDVGFQGNGTYCEDVNECLDSSVCNADIGHGTCVNTIGSYFCICAAYYEGDDCDSYGPKRHCADLRKYHNIKEDGAYKVYPPLKGVSGPSSSPVRTNETVEVTVYCDMTTDGGGWTLMGNNLLNDTANRTYQEYINGFGKPAEKNAWLGLDLIHFYTNYQSTSLRLNIFHCASEIMETPAVWNTCTYESFTVMDPEGGHRVFIPKPCKGPETAGKWEDGWVRWGFNKVGPKFVAYDDESTACKCSWRYHNVGWWYDTNDVCCGVANLNGVSYECENTPDNSNTYMVWYGGAINKAEMMLRPLGFPNYDKN